MHGYLELRDLAAANHVRLLHEAAVTLAPAIAAVASAGVGRPYKLVCQAERKADGTVVGSVQPEQVPRDEPLAGCDGATSIILFQMDVIDGLTLSEIHPDAVTTAYGRWRIS